MDDKMTFSEKVAVKKAQVRPFLAPTGTLALLLGISYLYGKTRTPNQTYFVVKADEPDDNVSTITILKK
jgi:hypothetical protein